MSKRGAGELESNIELAKIKTYCIVQFPPPKVPKCGPMQF